MIDDDDDSAKTMAKVLEIDRHDAFACTCRKDAMATIERLRPDIVLLDLAMPGLNGYEIARELGDCPDLRPKSLIAVSGYTDDVHRAKARDAGFDEYLLKPVDLARLQQLLALFS